MGACNYTICWVHLQQKESKKKHSSAGNQKLHNDDTPLQQVKQGTRVSSEEATQMEAVPVGSSTKVEQTDESLQAKEKPLEEAVTATEHSSMTKVEPSSQPLEPMSTTAATQGKTLQEGV